MSLRTEFENRYRTKAELAADAVRKAIATGQVGRGERLRLTELANALGISATPIREAVRILEAEGLVVANSHREIRVADFTVEDAKEIYEIRSLLESKATRQAVPKLSEAQLESLRSLISFMEETATSEEISRLPELNAVWHEQIYAAGSSKYLQLLIGRLWLAFPWDAMRVIPNRAKQSIKEHQAIMKAIEQRDADKAGRLMQEHILRSQQSVIAHIHRGVGPKV